MQEKKNLILDIDKCVDLIFHIGTSADYTHILQVDEDIEIINIDPFLFEYMDQKNDTYITEGLQKDIHRLH